MTSSRVRRALLAISVAGLALIGGLGYVFWRVLPPVIPAVAATPMHARPFKGVPVLPSVLPRPSLAGVRAAVLVEPENIRLTGPGEYDAATAHWRTWLRDAGAQLVAADTADVLVAPQAQCLGPIQRRLIAKHLARGGGLITTGPVGAYDGLCKPLPDTLISSLLGIKDSDIRAAPRRQNDAHYAVVLGETVLGAHLPPGPRLEFNPNYQIVFRTPTREMLYCDYERNPMNAGMPYFDAAAMRALVGPGRVVAFGFSPVDLVGDWSQSVGHVILGNAVRWASGRTMFQVAPWPNGHKAAAVLSQDVEGDYKNARIALDALEPYGLPGTAFIVGKLAEGDPETTRRLIEKMEIGTHTYNHEPLDTLPPKLQTAELVTSKHVAEQLAGKPVTGFRPPEERFTTRTLQDWADLGGTYVFVNNNMRSAGPEIIPVLPDSLVMLGRISEDDFELLERDKLRDRKKMSERIVSQVSESVAYRGLYMFSYHSHMFSQKELVPVLQSLAEKLKKTPEVWTTTAGQVAEWWRSRSYVVIKYGADGRTVTLTNRGPRPFAEGQLIVDGVNGERSIVPLPVIQPGASVRADASGRITAEPLVGQAN